MNQNMQIATTIRDQLYGIDAHAMMCLGVNKFVVVENGLQFCASGTKILRGGRVQITLNGLDLYDIEVFRVRKGQKNIVKTVNDIYFDNLTEVLTDIFG